MPEAADDSAALVVTSPPYPMIAMWDAEFAGQSEGVREALEEEEGEAAFEAMHGVLDGVWRECRRVLVPGGFACVNIGDAARRFGGTFRLYPNHSRIISAFASLGFQVLPPVIWRKQTNAPNKFMGSGMLPAGAYVTLEHEYILIFRKGGKRRFDTPKGKAARRAGAYFWEERNIWFSDLWDFKGVRQTGSAQGPRERTAAFPFELAWRLVNMYSLPGETVIDPFLGTGTTSLACMAAARNCTGYEIDPEYRTLLRNGVISFASGVNEIVRLRFQAHLDFIARREREGRAPGHRSGIHGFPVMTRQEEGITVPYVKSVELLHDGADVEYVVTGSDLSPPALTVRG